jgi:hypothetical protein
MRKKVGIRVLGAVALLQWGAVAVLFRASMLAPDLPTKANLSLWAFLACGAAVVLTLAWFVMSVIDYSIRRAAQMRAEAAGDALTRAHQVGLGYLSNPAATGAPAPAPAPCLACQQSPAVLLCSVHWQGLCGPCAASHLGEYPGCTLGPLPARPQAPQARPRPVATSPIGGLR